MSDQEKKLSPEEKAAAEAKAKAEAQAKEKVDAEASAKAAKERGAGVVMASPGGDHVMVVPLRRIHYGVGLELDPENKADIAHKMPKEHYERLVKDARHIASPFFKVFKRGEKEEK